MTKIERDVRPNQVGFEYPTMTEDELADFDVLRFATSDCHLFCWATHKFLPMAISRVEHGARNTSVRSFGTSPEAFSRLVFKLRGTSTVASLMKAYPEDFEGFAAETPRADPKNPRP